jgi:hypothetical protein
MNLEKSGGDEKLGLILEAPGSREEMAIKGWN